MKVPKGISGLKGMKRFGEIVRVLVRHGLGEVGERLTSRRSSRMEPTRGLRAGAVSPRRLRLVLQELGPSFVKLGQLLSIRFDLLPPEYIEELRALQDQVPPLPFAEIRQVVERELKRPVDEAFPGFDPESFAAASVAQVHHASLPTGEKVVVKVIRPGIEKQIREDIRLMYYFAEKIEKNFEVGRLIGAVNLVREFERLIFKELDMLIEAGSIEKFAHNFRDTAELSIPKVYWDYTTKSVLVMERIDGIKMDHVDELKAHGIDPKAIALVGLRAFSRQLMEFGFFHADPHPGNTIVRYDGRVSLVDFGITGYLDEGEMLQIAHIFLGYAEHNYDLVMEALQEAGLLDETAVDLESFRADLRDVSETFYGRPLQAVTARDVHDQIIGLLLKYHIRLPRNLLLLLKTLVQTESLGKILGSDVSLFEFTRPYARKLLERSHEAQRLLKRFGKESRDLGRYLRETPKFLYDVLSHVARGKQRLEVAHSGLNGMERRFERSVNRLTVGIVISASLLAAALVLNSGQKVLSFQIRLFGGETVSLTAVFGLLGYFIATILGLWLIISIYRSGRF
jgi:ubiquinone biosynthesis protein